MLLSRHTRRREFFKVLGSAAVSWPLVARSEQAERMRHIGVLMILPEDDPASKRRIEAFLQGLQQLNWIVGQNVKIDIR
jgi:putative ABC transport system substrate-binding protein